MRIETDCVVAPLGQILTVYGPEITHAILNRFECVHDSDTEVFLKEKAIDMELRDVSRTYIAISTKDMHIYGYISVSVKCL